MSLFRTRATSGQADDARIHGTGRRWRHSRAFHRRCKLSLDRATDCFKWRTSPPDGLLSIRMILDFPDLFEKRFSLLGIPGDCRLLAQRTPHELGHRPSLLHLHLRHSRAFCLPHAVQCVGIEALFIIRSGTLLQNRMIALFPR
jgi:hypothetical protein